MNENDIPTLWRSAEIDPLDRESFKQFGTSPFRAEFVYRLFDSERQLLYVGITWNPFQRWSAHARTKAWWHEIEYVEVWLARDERHARRLETWCIKNQDPMHNIHQSLRRVEK